ncbi:MAG: hypothetical protein CMH81_00960 [Nitrospiraceae bacterium]|nr:hypothetical protein [Nitrospiraceae bacterium]
MERTVAETIRDISREHIAKHNGILLGQCLTAVGWVQNTVPAQAEGIVELPMTDVSGAGIAVGAAIMGRRPIFIIRFQSLLWLNASPIVNHAAKAKSVFGYPAPVFVRAIGSEGDSTGPIHTNCFHSLFMHMPGLPVCAPMTPNEYVQIWNWYMTHDDPLLVSEHRRSYTSRQEMPDQVHHDAHITIYAMSAARFNAVEAVEVLGHRGVRCNLVHLLWLKPFDLTQRVMEPLKASGHGIVVDSAYEIAGASQSVAYELMYATGCPVKAVGQADRSPGVAKRLENGTPTTMRIVDTVEMMLRDV